MPQWQRLACLATVAACLILMRRAAWRDPGDLLLPLLCPALLAYPAVLMLRRPRWLVAAGPDGVSVWQRCRRHWLRWEHYSLEEITRAEAGVWGRILLMVGGNRISLAQGLSMAPPEARRCADAINSMLSA